MFMFGGLNSMMAQESVSLQEVWAIEDEYEFVLSMSNYIDEKCNYGSNFEALSHEEQVFYITQTLEMEVNNGGFWQFIYNADDEVFGNAVSAFSEIGAEKTALLCKDAFSAFEEELPKSRSKRVLYLMKLGMEKGYQTLSVFDDAFYATGEDLNALSYAYIHNHKDAFS